MKWPLLLEGCKRGAAFEPLLPQILFYFAEILNRGSFPVRETQCLKNPSKFGFWLKWNAPKVYSFGLFWGPMYHLKTKKIA